MSAICNAHYYITRCRGSSNVLKIRCWNAEHVLERLGLQAPGWAAQENGKETLLWPKEWGSICCSSVQPPTHLSHSKIFSNPFEHFQVKWEVYFSKEKCPLVVIVSSLWFCMYMYMYYVTIHQMDSKLKAKGSDIQKLTSSMDLCLTQIIPIKGSHIPY